MSVHVCHGHRGRNTQPLHKHVYLEHCKRENRLRAFNDLSVCCARGFWYTKTLCAETLLDLFVVHRACNTPDVWHLPTFSPDTIGSRFAQSFADYAARTEYTAILRPVEEELRSMALAVSWGARSARMSRNY